MTLPSPNRPQGIVSTASKPEKTATAIPAEAPGDMAERASEAAAFLKTLAHEGRLMILCHLATGEKSVGALETLLGMRQAAVSQMLARLRDDDLVQTRRDGKTIYYALKNRHTEEIITLLHRQFCAATQLEQQPDQQPG